MLKRCVIYLRVSTAEQAAVGHHSLDAQEILCRRYAEGEHLEVMDVLRDEGYSGRTSNRPGLRKLLEYTSAHPPVPINAILVQDTSRMGRDTTEYLLFRRELRERGIDLIAVTQPNIDSSPEGRLIDTIMAGINQYQSEEKGRRVSIAMQKKFEDGWWPGWAPLGYEHVVQEGKRIIGCDQRRFPVVQWAFREYATGRYAQQQLCSYLAGKGLANRLGQPITRTTMNTLLSNPFYWGLMRWSDQERIGKHQPATDRATWEKCQQVTAERNKFSPRTRTHFFLLAGLTRCVTCGALHTHTVNARKGKRYYHCPSRANCPEPYLAEADLEARVASIIQSIRLTDDFIERVIVKVQEVFARRSGIHEKEQRTLRRRQEILEQQRAAAEEKLLAKVLSDDAYQRQVPRINAELTEIQHRLTSLEENRQVNGDAFRDILLFARDIPQAYAQAPAALKRHYLRFFFENFTVQNRRIIEARRTEFFRALLSGQKVRTNGKWYPR